MSMAKSSAASILLLFLITVDSFLPSFACPFCPYPPKKPRHPPKMLPPPPPPPQPPCTPSPPPPKPKQSPPPPSPPPPPKVQPPPPVYLPPPPPPPKIKPPTPPRPPVHVPPPSPPPVLPKPCPPPPPPATCPIDAVKLDACVDLLGGLVHIGIGEGPEETCCPVLDGLVDLDAALCLCTTIKAKLLSIELLLPIALEVLVDCGKHPPSGFECPS